MQITRKPVGQCYRKGVDNRTPNKLIVIRLPWYSYDIPWIMILVPTALEYTIHGISTLIVIH